MKMKNLIEIPIDKVKPNPNQPRKKFDKEELDELVESIKTNGQFTPISVFKEKDNWIIISGERRWRAMKILKKKTINAIEKTYSDEKIKQIELIVENIQRKDLSEEERYNYFKKLMKANNINKIEELSEITGLSTTGIRNLFNAHETRQELDEDLKKEASSGVIHETLGLPKEERTEVIRYATKKELGARKTREFVRRLKQIDKEEVKDALFKEDITIEQGESISKLDDKDKREHAIREFKALKVVESNIVKNSKNRDTAKSKRELQKKLEKADTWIKGFKKENISTLRQLEKSIKVLLMAVKFMPVMDEKQKEKLLDELELFIQKCERGTQLAEKIKENITPR